MEHFDIIQPIPIANTTFKHFFRQCKTSCWFSSTKMSHSCQDPQFQTKEREVGFFKKIRETQKKHSHATFTMNSKEIQHSLKGFAFDHLWFNCSYSLVKYHLLQYAVRSRGGGLGERHLMTVSRGLANLNNSQKCSYLLNKHSSVLIKPSRQRSNDHVYRNLWVTLSSARCTFVPEAKLAFESFLPPLS